MIIFRESLIYVLLIWAVSNCFMEYSLHQGNTEYLKTNFCLYCTYLKTHSKTNNSFETINLDLCALESLFKKQSSSSVYVCL